MEFFSLVEPATVSREALQERLTIATLPQLCACIDTVISDQGSHGRIYCLWGEFAINREEIRHGVRFSLSTCPNALAWTVTREDDGLLVHCTINTRRPDADFIESIELFVEDWVRGLRHAFAPA